jgi:hypothetical protein
VIVRCVKIISPTSLAEVHEHPSMSVGTEYFVMEILAGDGRTKFGGRTVFRVLNPASSYDSLGLWDVSMFVIVSERIPTCWVAGLRDGRLTLAPAEWHQPGFWEDYFDAVPTAVATYDRLKLEILAAG